MRSFFCIGIQYIDFEIRDEHFHGKLRTLFAQKGHQHDAPGNDQIDCDRSFETLRALPSHQKARTPRMFADHHLIADPHPFLCFREDQARSAQLAHLRGNAPWCRDWLPQTSRAAGTRLHKGLRQFDVAPRLQFPKSPKAAACLSTAPRIEKTIVHAEPLCNRCPVHTSNERLLVSLTGISVNSLYHE